MISGGRFRVFMLAVGGVSSAGGGRKSLRGVVARSPPVGPPLARCPHLDHLITDHAYRCTL